MALILPNRFGGQTQQPQQGAAINWGNPIAAGLAFAALPIGKSMIDVVTNNPGVLGGSTVPVLDSNVQGRNLKFTQGTTSVSSISFGSKVSTQDLALAPCTFFFLLKPGQGGFAEHDNGSSVGWGIGFDATARFYFTRYFSSTDYLAKTSANTLLTGVYNSCAATYDGAGGATGGLLYVAGLSVALTTETAPSGTSTTDSAQTLFLGREFNVGSLGGNISLALFFRRQLDASEILELHKNPYQVFKAPPRRLYVIPAVASAAARRPQVFACT